MNLNPEQIARRRKDFRLIVDGRIGWEPRPDDPERKQLSREGSMRYLLSLGVPEQCVPAQSLLDYVKYASVRDELEALCDDGYAEGSDGFYFMAGTTKGRRNYISAAAYVAHRFIRKGRNVAWRTHTDLVSLERQTMTDGNTEDDIDMRFASGQEQFDLRAVYELLVVTDVKMTDTTGFEDRAITRIISDRAARVLPTLAIVSASEDDYDRAIVTPIGRCLSTHLLNIGVEDAR